jgi:Protein of unknown function (DUF4239)
MGSLAVFGIVFACVVAGVVLGMLLRSRLPADHLGEESKDTVKLATGVIATMTALVLGLLVASAKSSFDAQRSGLTQLAANVIVLDRALAMYGPSTNDTRAALRASLTDLIHRTWPESGGATTAGMLPGGEVRYESVYEMILALEPKTEAQRNLQAQALKFAGDAGQTRWLLVSEHGSSIPTAFLVVLVLWLALLFASFGLFTPRNPTALTSLVVCALVVSSAIFLILELDRPFHGIIQVSGDPLKDALAQLGK